MLNWTGATRISFILICAALFCTTQSLAVLGLPEKTSMTEQERIETLERIQSVQEKLKLLQQKLRVLERRKTTREATDNETAVDTTAAGPMNWQAIDETVVNPGEFGIYTYLLFNGQAEDAAAVGKLEDLILTIETLPGSETAATLGNRFLVPVEQSQSTIDLGRPPYDYKLSKSYLDSLGIDPVSTGPVLIATTAPLDPYAAAEKTPVLRVSMGGLPPERIQERLTRWHLYEKSLLTNGDQPLTGLFMTLLQDAGPTRTNVTRERLTIDYGVQ